MFKALPKPIIHYLHHNPAWLFVAVLLLFSYGLTQATGAGSLDSFLRCCGSLGLFSAPFLTLAHLWPTLSPRLRTRTLFAVYGAYSLALVALRPTVQNLPFTSYVLEADSFANQWSLLLLVLTFGLLQTSLWLLGRRRRQPLGFGWLQRLPLGWLAVGLAILLSLGITASSNGVQVAAVELSNAAKVALFFSVFVQCLLIYLPYYLLYYVHHHLLFRELLQQRGVVHYLLGVVSLLLLFTALHGGLVAWLPAVNTFGIHPVGITGEVMSDINLSLGISILVLSLPFIIVIEWYRKEQAIVALKAEKTSTELELLKEQINPHFFFNTLNNLYAMSLTQEEATPDTILKLSDLMRYVIYRGKAASVPLAEEVQYLRDYLDLQAIRLHKQLDLRFDVTVENTFLPVAPLLFVILVENAFKHGIEPAEEACFLKLQLTETPDTITFTCYNSVSSGAAVTSGGFGLRNLRRRLDLLYPDPDAYQLRLLPGETDYHASLTLPK